MVKYTRVKDSLSFHTQVCRYSSSQNVAFVQLTAILLHWGMNEFCFIANASYRVRLQEFYAGWGFCFLIIQVHYCQIADVIGAIFHLIRYPCVWWMAMS